MAQQKTEKHTLGGFHETIQGDREADCAVELPLLLLHVRMGGGD